MNVYYVLFESVQTLEKQLLLPYELIEVMGRNIKVSTPSMSFLFGKLLKYQA